MSTGQAAMSLRRLVWGALGLVLVGSVLVVPPRGAGASGDLAEVEVTRYGGADRFETSLLVAEEIARLESGRLEWVVLVPGSSWTDAVVAAPLAGMLGAPVLMSPSDRLRPDAAAFLKRNGVTGAVVIGADNDTTGVGSGVVDALRALGISVERVSGADRFETSVAVARRLGMQGLGAPGYLNWGDRGAILASGESFADALVAGVIGARGPLPILLTPPDRLHPAVAEYLRTAQSKFFEHEDFRGISEVLLMGGTAALSDAVEGSVGSLRNAHGWPIAPIRVAGSDRFHTAALAEPWARKVGSHLKGNPRYRSVSAGTCEARPQLGLARGDVPFDAFSAAPLLARLCAPLLLTPQDRTVRRTASLLDSARGLAVHEWATAGFHVFGGDAAVPQDTLDRYLGTKGTGTAGAGSVVCDVEATDEPLSLPSGGEPRYPSVHMAAWSPDCSRIAYVGLRGSLRVAGPDGSDAVRLSMGGAGPGAGVDDYDPAWSPDGSMIAFSRKPYRQVDGEWVKQRHIFVVNADGRGLRQLTFGNVTDKQPSWSPDGSQIAFERTDRDTPEHRFQSFNDRFIAVMNSDGTGIVELTRGGLADNDPEWSPDGRHIAYSYGQQDIHIMQASGALPRELPARNEKPLGGHSWSPDGQWMAIIEGELIDGDIWNFVTVTSLDGTRRQRIVSLNKSAQDEPSWAHLSNPRWSPDGRFILYEKGPPGTRLYVSEALLPAPAETPRECVLPKQYPRVGTHRAAVLFVDFSDAPAKFSTQEHESWTVSEGTTHNQFAETAAYAEDTSYGRLDVEFVPLHRWLRLSEPFEHYSRLGSVTHKAAEAAVEIAQSEHGFDFSGIDSVVMVLPGSRFINGQMTHTSLLGRLMPLAVINTTRTGGVGNVPIMSSFTHEFMHILGFGDLYNPRRLGTSDSQTTRPRLGPDQGWRILRIGIMGLRVLYPASNDAPTEARRAASLGWHRWRSGWLDPDQVVCVADTPATVELAPIADPQDGTALAVIRTTPGAHIYIESRRRIARDAAWKDDDTAGDAVLVYVHDPHTVGPHVQLATDNGYGYLSHNPLLELGDTITVHNHTITLIADVGNTHTVSITRRQE